MLGLLGAGLDAYGSYLGSKTTAPVDFNQRADLFELDFDNPAAFNYGLTGNRGY